MKVSSNYNQHASQMSVNPTKATRFTKVLETVSKQPILKKRYVTVKYLCFEKHNTVSEFDLN